MPSARTSALATALATAVLMAGGAAVAAPAQAAPGQDAASAAVTDLLTRLATDVLPQTASSSAVSQQLPTVAVTSAESVGLKTAFSAALAAGGQLAGVGQQKTLGDLRSYLDGADGAGWTFGATLAGQALTLGFSRELKTDAGLDVRDPDGTLSLSSGKGIAVRGTMTGSFTFVYTGGHASLTKPSLSIVTTADLPASTTLEAGLGILGVQVEGTADTTDYHLTSSVTTTWANPDNDAAGALAFDDPSTPAKDDGELAADGAGSGLVTAVRTGSVSGRLVAEPRAGGGVAGLPETGATIDLSSAAPATFEAPAVSSTVPVAAKPFLTMTPRDLAAALSQAASAVLGMQDAKDGALPLMRGTIGNAVDAVGGIKAFLADQVPDADPDDETPGQPEFASLQDMLAALDAASYDSGWSIDVLPGAAYDPSSEKVGFTVQTTRGGVQDLELNVLGAATTGTGTSYRADGLDGSGVDFDGPKGDTGAALAGRKVSAGLSHGTIQEVVDGGTLLLTADGWSQGQPADGTEFVVEAADPKTGAPEFADALKVVAGIGVANADLSTAKVTPDVVLTLPLALDLRAPATFKADTSKRDCNPDPAVESACPFKQVDASGLGRVITSLPLAADRVLLRQSDRVVLLADADISSPVQISTSSGFLALTVGGTVTMTRPTSGHVQTLRLTGSGDTPVPAFVEAVRKQAEAKDGAVAVFSQRLAGTVEATLDISVDDAPDAFAKGVDSTTLTVKGDVEKLADGDIGAGDVTVTPADASRAGLLRALNFEPDNPTSLFGGLQGAFRAAGSDLTTMTGGGLDTPIPFVGSSVGQLVGAGASGAAGATYSQQAAVADVVGPPAVEGRPATTTLTDPGAAFTKEFLGRQIVVGSTVTTIVGVGSGATPVTGEQTATSLVLAPALTLQPAADTPYLVENELLGAVHVLQALTPATLQEAVAMAQASLGEGSTIDVGLVEDGGAPKLRLDLGWERDYRVSRPVSLEFGEQQLVGVSGGGELSLDVSGSVVLRLLLPLTAAGMLDPLTSTKVDKEASTIDVAVEVAANGAHFGADLGPVSLDVGTVADPGTFSAGFSASAGSTATGALPSLKDFFSAGFEVSVENGPGCKDAEIVCATFPVYVSGAKANGPLTVTSTLGNGDLLAALGGTGTKVVLPKDLQNILDGTPFTFGTLTEGLQQYLFYAEGALRTASNGGEMPVIGKDLQAGADFLGATREELDAFVEANGDVSTVGPARDYLVDALSEQLDLPLNGDTGLIVGFTCNSDLEPPAAPTARSTPATPATGDTTRYVYEVVSVYKDTKPATPVEHFSVPSATSTVVTNAAKLVAGSRTNTVTWTKLPGVTSYKVLRATVTSALGAATTTLSAFGVVGTVLAPANAPAPATTTTVTYTDSATTTTAAPAVPAKTYRMPGVPCADDDSLTEIEGVTLQLKLGQGAVSAAKGCETSTTLGACVTAELPVDLGLPGLSLKTGDGGSVSGQVGWALDVKLGLSRTRGFYIDASKEDEFQVGAQLALDRVGGATVPDLQAQLAIIDVDVEKRTATPEFVGHFGIDIQDSKTDKDDDLTLTEMRSLKVADAIEVSVKATVDVDWHLQATASAALPGISTDFRLLWTWGASTGTGTGTTPTPTATPTATPTPTPKPTTGTGTTTPRPGTARPRDTGGLTVRFDHVTLDAGRFFGDALGPYLSQVVDATKPLQPILDTIFTPMPVISDLSVAAGGKPVTIASLGETFNTLPGGAKITPFLNAIKTVKKLKDGVKCPGGPASCGVDIGSFTLLGARTATTVATAGGAKSMIGTTAPNTAASSQIAQKDASKQLAGVPKATALRKGLAGLAIPVMDEPTLLFDLISGGDIPLVEFDSGPLTLGFQFQKSFGPIYAPPPVMMVIGGGAAVTLRVAAGFDTYGIRQAVETGDGAQVLDSLYFKTVDANGAPIPVVQFTGYLEAGASISLGVLEIGVLGGIKLTVGFYWNDPNSDGKFRLFEFSGAVATNPICLFNVGGQLSLYVKVFVVIGFSPFAVDFDFTLVNIKLLDFNLKPDCTPPPPKLGGTVGTTLYVFAGKHGETGPRGDKAWASGDKDETWVVRQVPGYTDDEGLHEPAVEVRGLGLTESFPDKGGAAIGAVVVDGRGYGGGLTVSFTGGSAPTVDAVPGAFTKTAVVFTGKGADVVRTGEGTSWVDTGAGDDTVTTLDRTDLDKGVAATAHVAGGPGSDVITVGNGDDVVTGDGALSVGTETSPTVTLAPGGKATTAALGSTIDPGTLADPADTALFAVDPKDSGDDQIAAGLGAVKLSGGGGDDTLGTANDSTLADSTGIKGTSLEARYRAHPSVLVGGAGSDSLKSGSAQDALYTGAKESPGLAGTGSGDAATDSNVVDTGAGSDVVYGSNAADVVTTHSTSTQSAVAYGGGAADVLTGGLGTDTLNGGPGDDYVVAAPATVGAPGSTADVLGAARDVVVLPNAGSSRKLLVGGTGSDRIYGSDGDADVYGDTTADGCTVPTATEPGETSVAGDAADLVRGGAGVDVVSAGGGDDWVYGAGGGDRQCGGAGLDHLYGGDGDDVAQGGTGDDQAFGEAGADQARGGADDDTLYGGAGPDRLQGGADEDRADGGPEADVLLGGASTAGRPDDADVLLGAEGPDLLVGDDAATDLVGSAPYPTDLGSDDPTLGGGDRLLGGDGDDRAYGGLEPDTLLGGEGDDALEGGPGTDTVSGEAGDDDLVGGSSQLASGAFTGSEPGRPDARDVVAGGDGQDVVAGDNALVTRTGLASPVMLGRGLATLRSVDLADEGASSPAGVSGGDLLTGGGGTDVVFAQRGTDDVSLGDGADYGEGGPDADVVHADAGDDDVVGGSSTAVGSAASTVGQPDTGDTLSGDAGQDVVLGDDGRVTRVVSSTTSALRTLTDSLVAAAVAPVVAQQISPLSVGRLASARSITAFDLGDAPTAGTSGADTITGDGEADVLLGQGGGDRVDGGSGPDYAEGGQGSDLVLGAGEDDDLVGGSSSAAGTSSSPAGQPDAADDVRGGAGSDLVLGDNGLVTRPASGRDWRTQRANATQTGLVPGRAVALHDLVGPVPLGATAGHSGADALSGQDGVDVLLGQDGDDAVSGGGDDDLAEGDGGRDVVHGDLALTAAQLVAAPAGSAWASPGPDAAPATAGQDDLLGGWGLPGHRDGGDLVDGDGGDDVVLGDNGSLARVADGTADKVYARRYGTLRRGSAKVRVAGGSAASTRSCPTTGTTPGATCEQAGASGDDRLYGSDGQDVLYGQDGGDLIWGGAGDDDAYGELGDDTLWGEGGDDALLGDRGGVQRRYEDGTRSRTSTLSMPPKVTYTSRLAGTVSRETDLLHDVDGDVLRTGAVMPLDGIAFGGADRLRGGDGADALHGGAGPDLANGDTGGDAVFGDGGADVLWGGKGRPCAASDAACQADPGTAGEWVDHLAGGKDDDVLDWRPRGVFGAGTGLTGRTCIDGPAPVSTRKDGTTDPCSWFVMTDRADDDPSSPVTLADNQHHQGIDWIYGGWDRDVLQADQSANGPNPGDRLIDWNGVYNLYSHCNAAYGGFNDLRSPAPAMTAFLQLWAAGLGAGRPGSTPADADVLKPGSSAYVELALVTTADGKGHGTGSAYPTTPGHFDDAGACDVS